MKIKTLRCIKCGYKWIPRVWPVKQCPRCKTYYWEKAKVANK